MYKLIVKRVARQTFAALSRGDYEAPLKKFAPDAHFRFAGENALGCDLHRVEDVRSWFQRAFRLFPDLRFEVHDVLVNGWPWRTLVASHFSVHATMRDGTPYENRGMQLLVLSWGRVLEDFIYEDTQHVSAALNELAAQGVEEAAEPGIGVGPDSHAAGASPAHATPSAGSQ